MLPRTVSFDDIQKIFKSAYDSLNDEILTNYQKSAIIRDIAVLELLFATGVHVSELCSLKVENIRFSENTIRIYGKGSKERIVQIESHDVLAALIRYKQAFEVEINNCSYFFVNQLGNRLSEQSVRFMIKKYTELANVVTKVTPHIYRHPYVKPTLKIFNTGLIWFIKNASKKFYPAVSAVYKRPALYNNTFSKTYYCKRVQMCAF